MTKKKSSKSTVAINASPKGLTTASMVRITKKPSASKKSANQDDAKVWRVGKLGKTGRILTFDWRDLTWDEAVAATEGSTALSIIPLEAVLSLTKSEQEAIERSMGMKAWMRLNTFRRDSVNAKWPDANTKADKFSLPKNRRMPLWIVFFSSGKVFDILTSEQKAGHFIDSHNSKECPLSCYHITVTVPEVQTMPRPRTAVQS
ncbi:MAG: hypothetical protein JWM11_3015 [Planctomycetaceae bacterium]|nr:hypothetical protein [Planctomycetaceae bacterium]